MSDLSVSLNWERSEPEFAAGAYSTAHRVDYNDALAVTMDAAPEYHGDPANGNPEQALAAALASCHMMTFLALAAKAKWPVASYRDHAVAHLGKGPKGRVAVTRIDLNPEVGFDDGFEVSDEDMAKMQDRAHRYCFVANSLAEHVEVKVG
ncbi:OsmC family protein [Palleronia caenipelagi]|uniref:OsmC family protein n=1 Tax=Palleronia caenipelagi TaxID=2489174 RepID=A0A547Q040_9RHOB|nr:OsmC family protein [Palleronia caenipelagi]TRD19747.1 OsmC family protein [Palleronia caenipelagi]